MSANDEQSIATSIALLNAQMAHDAESRESFRQEVLKRFDAGAQHMASTDAKLDAIKEQTTRTNGRLLNAEGSIAELKRTACLAPGTCTGLAADIRKLQDSALLAAGQKDGFLTFGKALWAVGGSTITAAVAWIFFRQ